MAKVYGMNGLVSGRRGNDVFAIRSGMQVVRQYNPSPMNPKSEAQVGARAKMKLLSQLSAVMAPVIAFRREGVVSARNLFTKANYPAVAYANSQADITLTSVTLTGGVVGLPQVQVTRAESQLSVTLSSPNPTNYDRVVYVCLIKQSDKAPRIGATAVVSESGSQGQYPTTLQLPSASAPVVVYAYGIIFNTDRARVIYGQLEVETAETVAKLLTTRSLLDSDVTVTETRARESNPV